MVSRSHVLNYNGVTSGNRPSDRPPIYSLLFRPKPLSMLRKAPIKFAREHLPVRVVVSRSGIKSGTFQPEHSETLHNHNERAGVKNSHPLHAHTARAPLRSSSYQSLLFCTSKLSKPVAKRYCPLLSVQTASTLRDAYRDAETISDRRSRRPKMPARDMALTDFHSLP